MSPILLWLRFMRSIFVVALLCMLFSGAIFAMLFAQPLQAQAATKLSIQFTCAQAVDYDSGVVCVHTQARAALTIKVRYCTGAYAKSYSLQGTEYADTRGNYTWRWVPNTYCSGAATAYVNENWNGKSLSASKNFRVA